MSLSSLQAGAVTAVAAQIATVAAAAESAAVDPRVRELMEPIVLSVPCCPGLRWGIVLGSFAVPAILRRLPSLHATAETVGLIRDVVAPIAIGLSVYFGPPFSLDCYLPEATAGLLTAWSVFKRARKL